MKRCEECGNEFEPRQPHHRLCSDCVRRRLPERSSSDQRRETRHLRDFLLDSYYDEKGNPVKELFIDYAQELARLFDRDKLSRKQLRNFFGIVTRAKNIALLKGLGEARPVLYECQATVESQLNRDAIPRSFAEFMKHHLELASRSERDLEGFQKHLNCILCYFPIRK